MSYAQNDDVTMINIPSGFGPLKFYGQRFTQVSISADGWDLPEQPHDGVISITSACLTRPTAGRSICSNWDDLYPVSGGGGAGYISTTTMTGRPPLHRRIR